MADKFTLRDEEERRVWDAVCSSNLAGCVVPEVMNGLAHEEETKEAGTAARMTMNALAVYSDCAAKLADRVVLLRRSRTELLERATPSDIALITR